MWELPHPDEKIRELSPLLHRFMSLLASRPTGLLLGAGLTMDSAFRPSLSGNALLDASTHTDTVAQGVTRGSLIYGNSTPKWDELTVGAAHRFLQSNGTDVSWVALSGDATLAAGVITVANNAVTYAKMQDVTDARLLGRSAGSAGDPQEITVGAGLSLASGDLSGHWALIATNTPSAAASTAFTGLSSTYFAYKVVWSNLAPATDGAEFFFRTSTDGGSTYDAGASDYSYARWTVNDAAGSAANADNADSEIELSDNHGSAANEIGFGELTVFNPSGAVYCHVQWNATWTADTGALAHTTGGGRRLAAADVDAIQFLFSSGNIASGTFKLYGMKA